MASVPRRYARQVRLLEVGEAGLRRLRAGTFPVTGDGLAGEVEARYLAGAGAGSLVVRDDAVASSARRLNGEVAVGVEPAMAPDADEPQDGHLGLRDPSARALGEGAFRALSQLRRVLLQGASS